MSRIHEALKKAEEQRAAAQGGRAEPQAGTGAETITSAPVAVQETSPLTHAPGMPSFSTPLTFETLLARCAPGNWTPDTKKMLFFNAEEQGYGTEEFRTLRSRLYHLREKQPLKSVLVTSSLPKEGKSFVAANLAQVMVRQQGRRALLIDGDLRGPRLHAALGTSSTPGLSDYLLGEVDEFGIMQRGAMENLFFIPAGKTVSNPAELVADGRVKALLNRVGPLFDWIIVDSPPAGLVSDASLLAKACDGVLIVVRSNQTPFDIARKARQEFRDEQLVGVVLNGMEAGTSPYQQYYYNHANRQTKS
jgi:capsular exopolysaccharide synthesis family protein